MTTIFNIRPRALNVGNDVIAIGLRRLLNEALGEDVNVISIPAVSKYESHGTAGLSASMIYQINHFGDGVVVGGGNLYENGELAIDTQALRQLKPPMMLYSLSNGRVYDRWNRLVPRTDTLAADEVKALHEKAFSSYARCNATLEWLNDLGIPSAKLGGCPTLFLDEITDRIPEPAPALRGLTLISVRTPGLMSVSPVVRGRVKGEIEAMIARLRAAGHDRIRLLCHDFRDIDFAASFEGEAFLYNDDARAFLGILKAAKLCVSYRLHASLPCFSLGVPCINISYDERARSLMETAGYGDWNIDMVACGDVVSAFADRFDRLAALSRVREHAAPRREELRAINRTAFADFARAVRQYEDTGRFDPA